MTGATLANLGLGELLGFGCAVVFSVYLIVINVLVPRDDPWRMACGQFGVVGAVMLLASCWIDREHTAVLPDALHAIVHYRDIWLDLVLLLLFTTLLPFILVCVFQPKVDPARAALIYLLEPVVAAAYAYVAQDHGLGPRPLAGILLIIIANVVAELLRASRDTH
jgi:drug/metabolite transporter (DMT)-like permease